MVSIMVAHPVKIVNNTGANISNYQQVVIAPMCNNCMNASVSNVFWAYDPAGSSIIPSWLGNQIGSSSAPTNANNGSLVYFLKIGTTIPAGATQTIYMIFADRGTTVWDGVNTGVAPLWTSVYGQYDNGTKVFNIYNNFAGTTLPSNYGINSNNGTTSTYSVNNGVFLENYYLGSNFSITISNAIYGLMKFSAAGSVSQFNSRFGYIINNENFLIIGGNSSYPISYLTNYDPSSNKAYYMTIPSFYNQMVSLGLWTDGTTTTFGMVNENIYKNTVDFYVPSNSNSNITVQALYENAIANVYAIMVGNAPPNGIMPTVLF